MSFFTLASALGSAMESWVTAGVLVVMLAGMISGRMGADLVMLAGLSVLLLTGVVTASEAVSGFANPAVLTVGFLYIVATGLRETGALTILTRRLLGKPNSLAAAQIRLMAPVAIGSAFVNNTPIVAMLLPVLSGWAKRNKLSASALFMPLSFAAILGGMCTLIGTSTNLVVAELNLEAAANPAFAGVVTEQFGMFTLAKVGVPVAVAGLAFMVLMGRRLLPGVSEGQLSKADAREYMVAMRVESGAAIIGRTVEDAGLRSLPGLFLARIDRQDKSILAVAPEQTLRADDVLMFVGVLDSVVDLQKIRGLSPMTGAAGKDLAPRHQAKLIEVVVSHGSPLLGRTIREGAFRTRYNAVVIAAHRNGERLRKKIGDIQLRAGDTLLLEATPDFFERYRDSRDFFLVSQLPGSAAPRHRLAGVALAILGSMVVAITIDPSRAMVYAMAAALLMILCRCCNGPQARESVDWQVLVVIGTAFGFGHAMTNSGLASTIADVALGWAEPLGNWAVLAGVFFLTAIFTSVITNNAAAVLVFPIALEVAQRNDMPFMPLAVCVAIAASAGFSMPLGYQTNLMVMGPGGYRTGDFVRLGLPLTILVGIVCVTVVALTY